MKVRNSALVVAILLLAAVSCKKEEEETPVKYVLGSLSFDIPEYVTYGDEISATPTGAYHPDSKRQKDGTYRDSLGYYFTTSYNDTKDTVKKFTDPVGAPKTFHFTIPDTKLGQIIFSAYAFAPDHYAASCTRYAEVVYPGYGEGHSLTGFNYDPKDPKVTLGNREYYTTEVNGKTWFRENVSLETKGVPCAKAEIMYSIFGGYYNYNEAAEICPEGWELPSREDFTALSASVENIGDLYGNILFNGTKMWTYWPDVKVTDKTRMSIIPVGFATRADERYSFRDRFKRAVFWTRDEDGDNATACYFYEGQNNVFSGSFDKNNFYASVRCIKKLF